LAGAAESVLFTPEMDHHTGANTLSLARGYRSIRGDFKDCAACGCRRPSGPRSRFSFSSRFLSVAIFALSIQVRFSPAVGLTLGPCNMHRISSTIRPPPGSLLSVDRRISSSCPACLGLGLSSLHQNSRKRWLPPPDILAVLPSGMVKIVGSWRVRSSSASSLRRRFAPICFLILDHWTLLRAVPAPRGEPLSLRSQSHSLRESERNPQPANVWKRARRDRP